MIRLRILIEFSNCMYDDPIYARVINLILIFFLLICFRTNARHGVGCPSVVAQYFYCATPSSDPWKHSLRFASTKRN
jgi:hypothetical protein